MKTKIDPLKTLSQSQAAWMLDISARELRDRSDVPRNDNGTYCARDIVAYATDQQKASKALNDDETEELLTIVDQCHLGDLWEGGRQGVAADRIFKVMAQKRGIGSVRTVFGRLFINRIARYAFLTDDSLCGDDANYDAEENLRIVRVCQYCNKVRRGDRWVSASPPQGFNVSHLEMCPECLPATMNIGCWRPRRLRVLRLL